MAGSVIDIRIYIRPAGGWYFNSHQYGSVIWKVVGDYNWIAQHRHN